eukprot:888368-Prymnesium_polylepis.1
MRSRPRRLLTRRPSSVARLPRLCWPRATTRLSGLDDTVLDAPLLAALDAFPGDGTARAGSASHEAASAYDPIEATAMVGAMLRADPSRRPSVAALLEHPF